MGKNSSEVGYDPATQADLDRYAEAERQLQQMQVPLLLDTGNPHQRLYIAAMDGTGNSIHDDDPEEKEWSAVGKIYKQILDSRPEGVAAGYVEGIGTQDGWIRKPEKWVDLLTGHSFEERLETAYYHFCEQAKRWLKEDPQAEIRVAGIGFSRGAELSAALSRVIHERGIMDPDTAKIRRDSNGPEGLVTHADYSNAVRLVEPGQTAQTLVLFDPVATYVTEHDRRIPPSVVSGIALMSEDRRDQFKGTQFFPDGLSENNRFYSVVLPGAHSDIGNSYARDGLGRLSHNLAVDYLNSQSNHDFLGKQTPSSKPSDYAIHRSEEHLVFFSTRDFDRDGQRDFINQLGPSGQCRTTPQPDCTQKAPHDAQLAGGLDWQNPRIQPAKGAVPHLQASGQTQQDDSIEAMFLRLTDASMRGDRAGMSQVNREYLQSPAGQAFLQQAQEYNQEQRRLAEERQRAEEEKRHMQEAQERQQRQQEQESQQHVIRRGPVMRM